MKAIRLLFAAFAFLMQSLCISGQNSNYFEVDGIRYRVIKEADSHNTFGLVHVTVPAYGKYKYDITIPNAVRESEEEFADAYKVVGIDPHAFENCEDLGIVTLSPSIESIGEGAFYCAEIEKLVIPYGNLSHIPEEAFYCAGISKISLPGSVRTIGESAFANSSITEFEAASGLKSIGNEAFASCTSLKTVVCNEGLEYIGESAFNRCLHLSSVKLPSSVKYIDNYAFINCNELKDFEFPSMLKEIQYKSFFDTALESIVLPEGFTTIGYGSLARIGNLRSITLPQSLKSVNDCAFVGTGLSIIIFPESLKYLGHGLFWYCEDLVGVYFKSETPPTFKMSSNYKYEYAESAELRGIPLPTLFKLTEDSSDFNPAVKIYVPKGCEEAYKQAEGWSLYADIIEGYDYSLGDPSPVPYKKTKIKPQEYARSTERFITIPEDVETIEEAAFYSSLVEEVSLPSTLTSIKSSAFYKCSALKKIELPGSVNEIGNGVFADCSSLEKIVIPEGITLINRSTFNACINLKSVKLPSSLKEIDENAFEKCQSLEEIVIPEGVTSIGAMSFSECINLKRIILPSTLETLGRKAFWGCNSLTEIVIPSSVTYVDQFAFSRCENLSKVRIKGSTRDWNNYPFASCDKLTEIIVEGNITEINPSKLGVDAKIIKGDSTKNSGAQAVDLGLSVKWSSKNLGALQEDEVGHNFAWGETKPRKSFSEDSYLLLDNGVYLRYCVEEKYGKVDGKRQLTSKDDAASVTLGDGWRLPTEEECMELIEKCEWSYVRNYGRDAQGFIVKGPSGNSIFIPYEYSMTSLWTSTMGKSFLGSTPFARIISLNIDTKIAVISNMLRYKGCAIRPVKN